MASKAKKSSGRVEVREPRPGYRVMPEPRARAKAERRALLDVNVLIALLDVDHLHHGRATRWLAEHLAFGWASCAVTQNGCVRIMSQPAYPNSLPAARVAERLREATLTVHHLFVPEAPSLLDTTMFDTEQLLGHRQVTDAWLLGVAVQHDLRVVTFDAAMPLRAVRGASAAHVVAL
ncbi:MAG TPA: TA system VapC family ribonuclease toxin [Burkholderiaceae bacterium]